MELDLAPWDGRRVPVTLLGGYLGAGKTTVVNEMLARAQSPIAVLVNDVGSVGIDAALVRRRHGDTIELTNGCICCSLRSGMADAFDALRARPTPPDHVVIELSGVADPRQVIMWTNSPGFRLDGIIVLVDASRSLELDADPVVGPAFRRQIEAADLIMVTKLDLVDAATAAATRSMAMSIAPGVTVADSGDPMGGAGLLALGTRHQGGAAALPEPSLFDIHDVATVKLPIGMTRSSLDAMLDALPKDTIRAKGIAQLVDGTRLLLQIVGRRRMVGELPEAEDQPPTDLVVITPRRR